MMDERADLARALLSAIGAGDAVLDDGAETGEIDVALPREALCAVPGAIAGFCREFDLHLVQLLRHEADAWHALLAWSDDVGRPRFLSAEIHADWYRCGALLLCSAEFIAPAPDLRFAHMLLKCVARGSVSEPQGRRLSDLWQEDPRGAAEQIARFWRKPADARVLAQAARHGSWALAATSLPRLRRALLRGSPHPLRSLAGSWRRLVLGVLEPARAKLAFVGSDAARREAVRDAVLRDLAPAFPTGSSAIAYSPADEHWGIDVRIRVDGVQPLPTQVTNAERAILQWLESRVERRFPEVLVGRNPPAARLLQFFCRTRVPLLSRLVQALLNCAIEVPVHAPILMPHPFGIVIERGARLGNRVTVMQQVTIGRAPGDNGAHAPVIEDNVTIGPGAKVIGALRIGRNATIGANAVVTRDVPSHCTVVGRDQILGLADRRAPVASARRAEPVSVVNS